MRLLIMGLPGAGKGTQAKVVAERLGIPAVSTGDILRDNVSRRTELGQTAKKYMDAGDYVPDDVVNEMVADRLGQPDAEPGFLLDGYPRTLEQVRKLDEILAVSGRSIDGVIELTGVDADEVAERLHKRAVTEGRADDSPEVIRRRLEVFSAQTQPLLQVYDQRGLLRRVNGLGAVEEVTERVLAVLAALQPRPAEGSQVRS